MRIVAPAVGTPSQFFGAVVVGTGDVWSDESDATYVYLPPGNSANPGWGRAHCQLPRVVATPPSLRAFARLKTDVQIAGHAPGVTLEVAGFGNVGAADTSTPPRHDPDGFTWVALSLSESFPFDPADASPEILVTYESFASPYAWGVYEAALVFQTPEDAPPCRAFPRSDGLGIGAGRNYPTPKSQQRSSRGVGYY